MAPAGRLSRWLWLVKWVLVVPHLVALVFLWIAFVVLTVVAFFAILFTGHYPRAIFDFVMGMKRWVYRVAVYATLMTDAYPPFRMDAGGQEPAPDTAKAEPITPSQHRRSHAHESLHCPIGRAGCDIAEHDPEISDVVPEVDTLRARPEGAWRRRSEQHGAIRTARRFREAPGPALPVSHSTTISSSATDGGNTLGYTRLLRAFSDAADAAEPRGVTPHTCRRTFASILIDPGASAEFVSDQLGHAPIKTTWDTSHLLASCLPPFSALARRDRPSQRPGCRTCVSASALPVPRPAGRASRAPTGRPGE
jgi:hypothetical protein